MSSNPLVMICPVCDGQRYIRTPISFDECLNCRGHGAIPTQQGRNILDMLTLCGWTLTDNHQRRLMTLTKDIRDLKERLDCCEREEQGE